MKSHGIRWLVLITGDLGVSPGSAVSGFPSGTVIGGTIHKGDAAAAQAQIDLTTAYNAAAGQAVTATLTGQDLGGKTLTPGVYFFANSAQLTGALTLNALGNPECAVRLSDRHLAHDRKQLICCFYQ